MGGSGELIRGGPALGEGGLHYSNLFNDSTLLVYDLGGGTFDLSLVRYDRTQLRVLAASGDRCLGGLDWDQCLVDRFSEAVLAKEGYDPREDEIDCLRLAERVEAAKRALSCDATSRAKVVVPGKGHEHSIILGLDYFEKVTAHLAERSRVLTEKLLRSAGHRWEKIDFIVPVGGPTQMPMIKRLIQTFAKKGPVCANISPDLSVAQGAALFAGIIHCPDYSPVVNTERAKVLKNFRTTNVSANGLALVVRSDGRLTNHLLIPKNTQLPVTVSVAVATVNPNQEKITVRVTELGADPSAEAKVVCRCTLDELPRGLPQSSIFDVDLTYDADGLLQVMAVHRDSGRLATVSTLHGATESAVGDQDPARTPR